MDFSLGEPERELLGLCRDFARTEIATGAALRLGRGALSDRSAPRAGRTRAARHAGPGEVGRDRDVHGRASWRAMEQIGLADPSVAAAWQAHSTIGIAAAAAVRRRRPARALAAAAGRGAEARRLRADRARCRLGRPRMRTRAERRDGGWVLNGQKAFISNAGTDMSFGVTSSPAPRGRLGQAAASAASSSRRTPRASRWDRSCAASAGRASTPGTCSSTTSGCPTTRSSASRSGGLGQFLGALEVGRISIAALSLGRPRRSLELALAYAKQHEQFGTRSPASRRSSSSWPTWRPRSRPPGGSPTAPPRCATPGSRSRRRPPWPS